MKPVIPIRQALYMRLSTLAALLLLMTSCVSACAPSAPPPDCRTVLQSMLAVAEDAPAGQVYSRDADPAGRGYLSGTLFAALYGPAGRGWLGEDETVGLPDTAPSAQDSLPSVETAAGETGASAQALIRDGAVYLSTVRHPFEVAVFRCADLDSALSVAALCQARLELLRTAWRDSEYTDFVKRAEVTVSGCYVLVAVTNDPDPLLEAGQMHIRSSHI